MKTQKTLTATAAAALLAVVAIGATSAHAVEIGTVSTPTPTAGLVAFSGGAGGTLSLPSPVNILFNGTAATFTFSPTTATSGAVQDITGSYDENLGNGTFTITGASGTLLSGTYSDSFLTVKKGSGTVQFGSNDVTYTGGSSLPLVGVPPLGPGDLGDFSLSFAGSNTPPGTGVAIGGYINNFNSTGIGGTFSGIPGSAPPNNSTPEPGSVVAMMIGGMFLLGAVLRRKTTTANFAA